MFDMQFMMAAVLVGALTRTAIAQEAAPGGWAPELVVDAFKKKHGVDILTAESFDREAWHDLKGQAMSCTEQAVLDRSPIGKIHSIHRCSAFQRECRGQVQQPLEDACG